MSTWETILTTAVTCFITLLVTFIFNWVVNRPAKKKKEKEIEKQERAEELNKIKEELNKIMQELRDDVTEERAGCKKDHCSLVTLIKTMQEKLTKSEMMDIALSNGLQSVLRDLLKIRYLEWVGKGYTTIDAKDDLEHMYEAYHNLGGNSTITELRNKFIKLPLQEEIHNK